MLALLLFGLLASGLPFSQCQPRTGNSFSSLPVRPQPGRPQLVPKPDPRTNLNPKIAIKPVVRPLPAVTPRKDVGNAELLEKLDVLGNELERLGKHVAELVEDNQQKGGFPAASTMPKLKVLKASREVGLKVNKFTVQFKAPEDCPSVPTKWLLKPLSQAGESKLVSRVSSLRQPDGSDLCETTVDVTERGELTLTLVENNRFEIFLRLDNSKTSALQHEHQSEVPVNEFSVETPDVVSYKAGEKLNLPVSIKNADNDDNNDNIALDIQYLTPDKKIMYFSCQPGVKDDFICNSEIKKKYLSSMDAEVSINTARLKPIGYTRVSTTHKSDSDLVTEAKLTRVLSIRPSNQIGPYPPGFTQVLAIDNKCSYTEKTCTAKCIAFGNNVDEKSIVIERVLKGDIREKIKEIYIGRKTELGQASASTEFTVPASSEGIRAEPFACRIANSKDLKGDLGIVSYKVETRVVRDKSFYEINEREVKVTCTAEGDKEPEVAAVLSMKPSERGAAVELRHSNVKVNRLGLGQVSSVFYYNHNFGRIDLDKVAVTCFARSDPKNPYDIDKFTLTDAYYLKRTTSY